jgi:hypothetical protein
MRNMSFDAYRQHHRRVARRAWFAVVFVSVAVGYAASQASSLLIGGVVTVVLLVGAEIVYRGVDKAVWLKRFPELDNPNVRWAWRGWLLKSDEGTTFANRSAKAS